MKFYDVVEELQKDNKGYIVLVRCGIFFTAIGKDAVILQSLFGLAPVCIKKNVCKCGFPVIKVNKFINISNNWIDFSKSEELTAEQMNVISLLIDIYLEDI